MRSSVGIVGSLIALACLGNVLVLTAHTDRLDAQMRGQVEHRSANDGDFGSGLDDAGALPQLGSVTGAPRLSAGNRGPALSFGGAGEYVYVAGAGSERVLPASGGRSASSGVRRTGDNRTPAPFVSSNVISGATAIKSEQIEIDNEDATRATVSPAVLPSTTGNWATAQTVTVSGVAGGAVTATNTPTGAGYASATAPDVAVSVAAGIRPSVSLAAESDAAPNVTVGGLVSVRIAADDTVVRRGGDPAVVVSPVRLGVPVGGSHTYEVVLASRPTRNVVVSVASEATDIATVSVSSLSFGIADWATAQTVTVTGAAGGLTRITHGVSGGTADPVGGECGGPVGGRGAAECGGARGGERHL